MFPKVYTFMHNWKGHEKGTKTVAYKLSESSRIFFFTFQRHDEVS